MPRLKRALHFFCCLRAAEFEVAEDPEYTDMLERVRVHQETWRQRELARFKTEMEEDRRKVQQKAVQPTLDLVQDKAVRGVGGEMANVAKERERALEQQRISDIRMARLMEIRCQTLKTAIEVEKIRKELAAVLFLETKISIGTVLINQGVNGTATYVIWKGSINIISKRKGKMTTLKKGEEVGNLALTSKRPQDASVIRPREHDCHFLRVENMNLLNILRDVNAATVHVQENGTPALMLYRSSKPPFDSVQYHSYSNKFMVMSGTPDKILEFVLFSVKLTYPDNMMESVVWTFLLTHHLFMAPEELCSALLKYLHGEPSEGSELVSATASSFKDRVVKLVSHWVVLYGHLLLDNPVVVRFLEKLTRQVKGHANLCMVREYISQRRCILLNSQHLPSIRAHGPLDQSLGHNNPVGEIHPIRARDQVLLKVFRQDHSCVSLMTPLNASAGDVMKALKASGNKALVKMKSSGTREQLELNDRVVSFGGINERLFLCPPSQTANLTPLREQLGPEKRNTTLDNLSAKAIAAQLTSYDWELFHAMHETELLYYVFGKRQFPYSTTANLERLMRRFSVVTHWVVTELCLCKELSKRAGLISKFIKIATHLYTQQNMSSFLAVLYGLTHRAITRLHQTWEQVPTSLKKKLREYQHMLDPHNNHAALREVLAKLSPPFVPYVHLVIDDLLSIHKGLWTLKKGLVNFEKMKMIGRTLNIVKGCRSEPYSPISPQNGLKSKALQENKPTYPDQSLKEFDVRKLKIIDDQTKLTNLSMVIEP